MRPHLRIAGAALAWLAATALATGALAVAPHVDEAELSPSPAQRTATQLVTHFIANYHYRKTELDDALSARILERYLESLDANRSYFTQRDVERFRAHSDQIDDYLRSAQLETVYDIFKQYRRRVRQRIDHAKTLLEREFDFTVDESYVFDRTELPWPADEAALEEIWRKRVKNDILSLRLAGKEPGEIRETLGNRYEGIARRTMQLDSDDVFQMFVNAYTTSVEPHTSYFSPRTSENFRIRMSLSLEGIGAVLQSEDVYTLVREVVAGGPADKSGQLHADDRIVGVGQGEDGELVDVVGWRLDDVVDLIRGPKGTVVRLEVLPKGTGPEGPSEVIAITRNKIELEEQAAQKSIMEVGEGARATRLGVIDIPTFYLDFDARQRGDKDYRSTTRDVRALLQELENEDVDGIIVDLRGNGGGSLTEATELTGLFIETGPIVQVRSADGRIQVERDTDPAVEYTGPLAVLVDRNSASASEIFAGAIQDYHRGIILGEPTFGKGTVQNLVDLSRLDRRLLSRHDDLGQLKTTIAQFFRVGGASTQHRGVVPDIVFPTAAAGMDDGERALDNALPWDRVEPAKYVPVSNEFGTLEQARRAHAQRVSTNESFQVLLEQVELVEEAQEKTRVSLVESERRSEMERTEQANRARENRLRAAQGLPHLPEEDEADAQTDGEDGEARTSEQELYDDVVLQEAGRILKDLLARPDTLKATGTQGRAGGDYATGIAGTR